MSMLAQNTYREIYRQPLCFKAVAETWETIRATIDECFKTPYDLIVFTGCGTSCYLAQSAQYLFASQNDTPAIAVPCSELYYNAAAYCKGKRVLVVPFTRKSITTEVRMAIDAVHKLPSVTTLSVTCDEGSAAYNDYMLLSPDADEKSIVMTGTFSSMVYIAALMSMHLAGKEDEVQALLTLPEKAEKLLKPFDELTARLAADRPIQLLAALGQQGYYGIANETMNKVKEMSLTHAEAHHTLEYRHGPMSLADETALVVVLSCEETVEADKTLLSEMKDYGALTCAIGKYADAFDAHEKLVLDGTPYENVVLCSYFGQLLGYHLALKKGLDADTPRHLSQAIVLKNGK